MLLLDLRMAGVFMNVNRRKKILIIKGNLQNHICGQGLVYVFLTVLKKQFRMKNS